MKVKFGMYWTEYGIQEIELPEGYEKATKEDIIKYIDSIWDTIPLPQEHNYVLDSDNRDFKYFEIIQDKT